MYGILTAGQNQGRRRRPGAQFSGSSSDVNKPPCMLQRRKARASISIIDISMAAAPGLLAPRAPTPTAEENEGKTVANGLTDQKVIKINVSGYKFYTYLSTLTNYPDTLLGSTDRECHFNKDINCYFFDRNRKAFEAILNFYRTGHLQCPNSVEIKDFENELEFFRITARNNEENAPAKRKPPRHKGWPRWQRKIYYVVAEPGEDIRSRIWAFVDTFFILCSIILFIAETEPYFKERIAEKNSTWYYVFFWGDAGCVLFFSADFLIRLVVWPGKLGFVKSVLNWLDFLAILPFFIMIITEYMISGDPNNPDAADGSKGQFVALKVLRLMRVIRLLKLARHSDQLMIIVNVLKKSLNELSILVLLWMIGIVTFGSIIYYADNNEEVSEEDGEVQSELKSIMMGCWWAVVTMSTVGYGDIVPKTGAGKVLGSVVVFLSMIFLALPMTIIVSKFSSCYDDLKYQDEDDRYYESSDEEDEEDPAEFPNHKA
ncbi:potassium voltage-gated channel subfamily A member 2-like isoform X7 [Bolinopsis microptera]|uniref:potassium voltage-gated channel subfamily A member 2-like isoform X7 n=1 Tax=Bolinopsis microptera TaxID=2820187 RepID=UPI00307ADF0E